MHGKAHREPASANQAAGSYIDYRCHLADMIKQSTLTEYHFSCPQFIVGGIFSELA